MKYYLNLKLYPQASDLILLGQGYLQLLKQYPELELTVAPPLIWLASVSQAWRGQSSAHRRLHLMSQSLDPLTEADQFGAATGAVSAGQLTGLAQAVLIGHSESRARQAGQSQPERLGLAIKQALIAGLEPVYCLGEAKPPAWQRADFEPETHLYQQLNELEQLHNQLDLSQVVIAYEPIFAISGSNRPATPVAPAYLAEVMTVLRRDFPAKAWLYGGSVKAAQAAELASTGIDGFLIGSAALKLAELSAIIQNAESVAPHL